MKIAYLISHPIQYHSPLFQKMDMHPEIDLTVLYCSEYGLKTRNHPDIGKLEPWDIPLLAGYKYKFFKNYSPKQSIFSGFFGLMNFPVANDIIKEKYDLVIVNGWRYFIYVYVIFISYFYNFKVAVRGDNTLQDENNSPFGKRTVKKILLGQLFRFVDYFFYVGNANRKFFEYHGIDKDRLVFTPHSVDNNRFTQEYKQLLEKKDSIREKLKINQNDFVVLFVGIFIDKKQPLDLLKAYTKINYKNKKLIFVGTGPLQKQMTRYIEDHNIKGVVFPGFKNQTELGTYYIIADVFVLPSSYGETWGLVVNEAMNFHLPVIISNTSGCSEDLVKNDLNGYVFQSGDINGLSEKIEYMINHQQKCKEMGSASAEIISNYSYEQIINNIYNAVRTCH